MPEINEKADNELLNQIHHHDNDELATYILIDRYKSLVEVIAMKYINSPFEKDDLIQEGMIGLLAAIHSFNIEKGASFNTYASKCINNSIQSALRKFSRLKDIPQSNLVMLEEDYLEANAHLSAEDEYLANSSVNNLNSIIYEELSRFENEVLRLYIVGCSYSEIAKKLDKNTKAIDNAIQRIRKKLNGVTF